MIMGDFWVFGYGSLIWNPGFPSIEAKPARLYGLHRSLCIYSWVHRGTKSNPGLVLGLDKGGSCQGVAYKVAANNKNSVIEYLRQRELVTDVYLETWRMIHFSNGTNSSALTYIADQKSAQYAGRLSVSIQTNIVSRARGKSGPNCEYVIKTAQHLQSMNIQDLDLASIAKSVA